MTNVFFERLQRDPKFRKKEEAPAATGLGAAIENLIAEQVAEQVEAAVEKQRPYQNPAVPEHRRPFTDKAESHEFPGPPPARTAPPKDLTVQLHRDETGRPYKVTAGSMTFNIQRDSAGRAVRMVAEDNGDATPVPPAPLNKV